MVELAADRSALACSKRASARIARLLSAPGGGGPRGSPGQEPPPPVSGLGGSRPVATAAATAAAGASSVAPSALALHLGMLLASTGLGCLFGVDMRKVRRSSQAACGRCRAVPPESARVGCGGSDGSIRPKSPRKGCSTPFHCEAIRHDHV